MGYIYLTFNDLTEKIKEELTELALEEAQSELTDEDIEFNNLDTEDIIDSYLHEQVDSILLKWSHEGKFVFNI
jgi:hypothetical protein